MENLLLTRPAPRARTFRVWSQEYTWSQAREALQSIRTHGLRGSDRPGLYRKNLLGMMLQVRNVETALSLMFRGDALYARGRGNCYEEIRNRRDLKEIFSLWGLGAIADTSGSMLRRKSAAANRHLKAS